MRSFLCFQCKNTRTNRGYCERPRICVCLLVYLCEEMFICIISSQVTALSVYTMHGKLGTGGDGQKDWNVLNAAIQKQRFHIG